MRKCCKRCTKLIQKSITSISRTHKHTSQIHSQMMQDSIKQDSINASQTYHNIRVYTRMYQKKYKKSCDYEKHIYQHVFTTTSKSLPTCLCFHKKFKSHSKGIGLDLGIGCGKLLTIITVGESSHDIRETHKT